MERNSPGENRRKAYETLCTHSLFAFARMGHVPPNKDTAQGDIHLSCASASPRATSKRCSQDLDHPARRHTPSKKARLSSTSIPSTDINAIIVGMLWSKFPVLMLKI